jgi:hypothetical protein
VCCTTILPCYYTVPYTKEHLVLVCCTTILLPCYYTTFLNRGKCTKLYSIVVPNSIVVWHSSTKLYYVFKHRKCTNAEGEMKDKRDL